MVKERQNNFWSGIYGIDEKLLITYEEILFSMIEQEYPGKCSAEVMQLLWRIKFFFGCSLFCSLGGAEPHFDRWLALPFTVLGRAHVLFPGSRYKLGPWNLSILDKPVTFFELAWMDVTENLWFDWRPCDIEGPKSSWNDSAVWVWATNCRDDHVWWDAGRWVQDFGCRVR